MNTDLKQYRFENHKIEVKKEHSKVFDELFAISSSIDGNNWMSLLLTRSEAQKLLELLNAQLSA